MKLFTLIIVVLMATAAALALPTLTLRVDETNGGNPKQTVIVNLPNCEIWAIGVNAKDPTYRIGKFVQVAKTVKVGGYIGVKADNVFLTPAVVYSPVIGNGKGLVWVEYQHNLNGAPDTLSLSEARILWPTGIQGLEVGPAIHGTFQDGKKPQLHEGMAVKLQLTKTVGFYVRWCPFGVKPETLRAQCTFSF